MDFTEINSRGKRRELLGRIDRQNSRFRTAKTIIIKYGLHASFVESESAKNALNERKLLECHKVGFPGSRTVLETESAGRRPGQNRRQATTPNEDRYLVLTARSHRNMNATLLQQHLRYATGTTVSTQTVRNRLQGVGLYSRRPMAFVPESVRFGGRGVLVYCGISIDGRTDLYIIRDGPLTARRYRDEILRPIVVPHAAAIGDDFILMDDKSRPHHANLVEDSLFEEGIVRMEWPACSPNMNSIEHV
ncbi:transposable element Tcb2 transposase [Trichonephila clavipes]|nr:transposable element Tcb2 transposase [Trichonephila clavipes]